MQRFESILLAPAIILGTPAEAGLNQKNSTSARLRRALGLRQLLIFIRQRSRRINAPLQQASLSSRLGGTQWSSQKPFNRFSYDLYFRYPTPV